MTQALPYLGPWCCELGEVLGLVNEACPVCIEFNAMYQLCMGPGDSSYVWFTHSDMARDLRTMSARAKWRAEYQNWRRAGKPKATPAQILAGQYLPAALHPNEWATA